MKKRDLNEAITATQEPPSNNLSEPSPIRGLTGANACVKTAEGAVVCGVLVGGAALESPAPSATPAAPTSRDGTPNGTE